MPKLIINVVDNYPKENILPVEIVDSSYLNPTRCLYVPIPRNSNLAIIDNLLNHLNLEAKSPNFIVFRFHKPDFDRLISEKHTYQIKVIARRFSQSSIYFLTWDNEQNRYLLEHQSYSFITNIAFDETLFLEQLRHGELQAYISKPNVILPEDSDYHYVFSNGNHYKKFLRVGNALSSKDILDAFCFWLLPYVQDKPLIFLDSNSILCLGFAVIHYCHECNIIHDTSWFGSVECVSDYLEPEIDILLKLEKKLRSTNPPTTILNVFSAKGTGRLYNRIISTCAELDLPIVKNVLLFSVPQSGISDEDIFCHLDEGFSGIPINETCPYCNDNSVGIRIDEKTYTLDLPAAARKVSIDTSHMSEARSFFDRYRGSDCFSLHRQQHDGNRHHMIHVDISKLLENKEFEKKVISSAMILRENVDIIIHPEHEAARKLALLLQSVFNVPIVSCDHNKLVELNEDDKQKIRSSKRILLVDDVVISGTRIHEYKNFLNYAELKTEETEIRLFVALARPDSDHALNGVKDYLFPHSNFICCEKIILPNWNEDLCPWCWEERELSNIDGKLIEDDHIQTRYNKITDKNNGISKEIFLQLPLGLPLKHGATRTVFCESQNEVEIFVSIASTIQRMRSEGVLHEVGQQSKPVAKVYDIQKYISGRYYEDFIKACIFRASVRNDMWSSKVEGDLKLAIDDLIHKQNHSKSLIPEIILSMAQGKLPKINFQKNVFESVNPGIGSFLKLLIEKEK